MEWKDRNDDWSQFSGGETKNAIFKESHDEHLDSDSMLLHWSDGPESLMRPSHSFIHPHDKRFSYVMHCMQREVYIVHCVFFIEFFVIIIIINRRRGEDKRSCSIEIMEWEEPVSFLPTYTRYAVSFELRITEDAAPLTDSLLLVLVKWSGA